MLETFMCFACVHLRLSRAMFSPALWSSQGCSSNLICGLGECSSCWNFTCYRQDASCCDHLVVYKTGLYGFVWVSPLCLLLPAPFVPPAGFASEAANSRAYCCRGIWDSPVWHLGMNHSWSKSTGEVSPCTWTGVPEALCTRQLLRPASRSRLTSPSPIQLVTIMVQLFAFQFLCET